MGTLSQWSIRGTKFIAFLMKVIFLLMLGGFVDMQINEGRCIIDTPLCLLPTYVNIEKNCTPWNCIEACRKLPKPKEYTIPGFILAGVEYGNECWCGNGNITSVWDAPAKECNMPCSGGDEWNCGGPWRLNV